MTDQESKQLVANIIAESYELDGQIITIDGEQYVKAEEAKRIIAALYLRLEELAGIIYDEPARKEQP